jgi:hypothetical protein
MIGIPRSWSKLEVGTTTASGDISEIGVPEGALVAGSNDAFNNATPPPGSIPSSKAARCCVQSILAAILLLRDLHLRRTTHFDNGNTTWELSESS